MSELTDESKIYFARDWYLRTDAEGYYADTLLEGSLGYILTLRDRSGGRLALKIPKLVADTLRENNYVSSLLGEEELVVHLVAKKPEAKHLVPPGPLDRQPFKKAQCFSKSRSNRNENAVRELLLVQFEKGRPPRFCCVDASGAIWPELPKECRPTAKQVEALLAAAAAPEAGDGDEDEYATPATHVIVVPRDGTDRVAQQQTVRSLEEATQVVDDDVVWYAFLPSIVYKWMDMTLEAVVQFGRPEAWSFAKHLQLGNNILRGFEALHGSNALHGDVRLANIMVSGDRPEQWRDPDHYYLVDYGSFRFKGIAFDGGGGGGTIQGQRVGNERSSHFYSRERRSCIEKENADFAIVMRKPNPGARPGDDDSTCLVLLGWRRQLNGKDGELLAATLEALDRHVPGSGPRDAQAALQQGDRVRLRDFVFVVERETQVEALRELRVDGQPVAHRLLECHGKVWRVLHDKLVVPAYTAVAGSDGDAEFSKPKTFAVPSVVELPKWGVHVDIYSLGALLLYSVYRSSAEAPQGDDEFRQLLTMLEGEAFFTEVWPLLDKMRQLLEEQWLSSKGTATEATRVLYGSSRNGYVHDQVETEVGYLTRNVPGLKQVCGGLDNNLAHFVFFLHFVLCCLHRRESLPPRPARDGFDSAALPFCARRNEEPQEDGPARIARQRVESLLKIAADRLFEDAKARHEVPKYERRGAEMQSLTTVRDKARRQEEELQRRGEQIERLKKLRAAVGGRSAMSAEMRALLDGLDEAIKADEAVRAALKVVIPAAAPAPTTTVARSQALGQQEA